MHILIVLAHPNEQSFSHSVAERAAAGAKSKGHTVKLLDLYRTDFDPIFTTRDLQQFEGVQMPDDVLEHQKLVDEADGIFFIFPVWWYGMPAMMKGWLDRVWSAGWAYRWKHDPEGSLLKHRPCTVLALTGASSNQLNRWSYDKHLQHVWRYGVFGYCSFEPLRITFLEDCAFDGSGKHAGHLEKALLAGQQIGNDPEARPGINYLLHHGLDYKGEKYVPQ
jgi:NAD(P)H dehydrogenase (quinone)